MLGRDGGLGSIAKWPIRARTRRDFLFLGLDHT